MLGARRQPAADEAVVRAGQPRHRRRWRNASTIGALDIADAGRASRRTTRSTWWCPGRRRRWSPASPTRWRRPASPAAARRAAAARLEGSKTFTKEICDAAGIPTALWERFDDADAARANSSAAAARRSWSRPTGSPPARAWWWRRPRPRRVAAIDAIMEQRVLRRGRRRGGDRGVPGGRGGVAVRAVRRRGTRCCSARRRTTSASATATPARTPAAWAPIRRRRLPAGAGAGVRWTRIIRPALAEMARARHAVPRHPVRRPDADRGRRRS